MLISPHFLTGVAIASQTPEMVPAALAAFTSHFVLDAIPHKDSFTKRYITLPNVILVGFDGLLTLALFYWLVPREHWAYCFGIGTVAMLPDIITIPGAIWPKWFKLPIIKQFYYWHTEILQYSWRDIGWIFGLLPQLIVVSIAIYFLAR